MDEAERIILLNTGPGSTPQEPLALVAKMSNSERSALESVRRGGLTSVAEAASDTTIQYRTSIQQSPTILLITSRLLEEVYYLLYADDYEIPSKVAFDPERPSLGRIHVDSVAPPHSPTSIKRCISRVEENPALAWLQVADLFVDTLSDTPLKEGHISILRADGPGWSPNEPMAIVQVKNPSISNGKYIIKNRAKDIYWNAGHNPIKTVCFYPTNIENAKIRNYTQVKEHSPIFQSVQRIILF